MYTCVRTSTVGIFMPVPPVAFAMSCLAHMPHGQCPQTLCFRLMPIAMQGSSNPPLPPDVPFIRVLVQSRVMCEYPIRGASSPGTHTPIFGTWPSAMCRQPESRPAMSFTDHRVGLVVCLDATSAGHRIEARRCHFSGSPEHVCGQRAHTWVALGLGSTMPLQRVIGSDQRCHFSGSLDRFRRR